MHCRSVEARVAAAPAHPSSAAGARFSSFAWLVRRLVVNNAGEALALAAFAVATAGGPSAIGAGLAAGIAILGPYLGGFNGQASAKRRHTWAAVLVCVEAGAAAWLLAQYAAQLAWLRDLVWSHDQQDRLFQLLAWLGLQVSWAPGSAPEPRVRWHCLLLAAARLNRMSQRWLRALPEDGRRVWHGGQLCCVFWPVPSALGGWWRALMHGLQAVAAGVAGQLSSSTDRLLSAVDWAAGGASPRASWASALGVALHAPRQAVWLAALTDGTCDFAERFWADWGAEVAMASLLAASFTSANALSLVLVALVAIAMAAPSARWLWRGFIVPLIGCLLLLQYALWLGPPPILPPDDEDAAFRDTGDGSAPQALLRWLALSNVQATSLWGLCVALLACMQQAFASDPLPLAPPAAEGEVQPPPPPPPRPMFRPLRYSEQGSWRAADWWRYEAIKHSRDAHLVAVAAVCFLQRDILHAGYLALALVFARRRGGPGSDRSLFRALPAFNMAAICLQLAYQVGGIMLLLHLSCGFASSCSSRRQLDSNAAC